MPSQLKRRLESFLDSSVATAVNGVRTAPQTDNVATPTAAQLADHTHRPPRNTHAHWLGGSFGQTMNNIQSIMIHGTSGWPSYASAENFRERYQCVDPWDWSDFLGRWTNSRGIGPQYFVEPNGTVYTLLGPENLDGDPLFTWHSNAMSFVSLGIENSDGGDSGAILPDAAGNAARFHRLDPTKTATDEDLDGRKLYGLTYPAGAEDLNLIWFALLPGYDGPGDISDITHRYSNWKKTLFTENDYRSLALLCRFLLEKNGLPRNFPLFPWSSSEFDTNNAALFRSLVLADPLRDQIVAGLGLNMSVLQAGGTPFATVYGPQHGRLWSRFFGIDSATGRRSTPCFRGIISHLINGGHRCPGPLFDWHRFAREVWDWWWYPFDFEANSVSSPRLFSTERRPYMQARGDTPLVEYYFDAAGQPTDYEQTRVPLSPADRFVVADTAPVYAMANGHVVAARMSVTGDPATPGFILTRHEVFHERTLSEVNEVTFDGPTDRIDYDSPPTYVWSLITYLSSPAFILDDLREENPDWLNRFVVRLKECELAVAFHRANPGPGGFTNAWGFQPAGAASRPTTGTLIERDAEEYRRLATALSAQQVARFPLETDANHTPVRMILGDFVGKPSRMPGGTTGIQIEIFSTTKLDIPGAAIRPVSAAGEEWWRGVSAAARGEALPGADLPANGSVWQYSMASFLEWFNTLTWKSEWLKYGANVPMPRPHSRTNF